METQERESRVRRELEERLEQARRKYQELQQTQKEAESYKDRLQTIKEKNTEEGSAVGSISSGEHFSRQLFIQPGEGLEVHT